MSNDHILFRIAARKHDLGGGLHIRRLLPSPERVAVGPFVFIDYFGPITLPPERPMDVRPHPHIGLATLTYLFEGRILHRDSLGSEQLIEPGAVNWMTCGRGIVHSERSAEQDRGREQRLHGLQLWLALPQADESTAPAFSHTPAESLPELTVADASVRIVAGQMFGVSSPVPTIGAPCLVDVRWSDGGRLPLPAEPEQRAVMVIDGALTVGEETIEPGELAVLTPSREIELNAHGVTRAVIIGGPPIDAPRYLYWNFVASDPALIEQAKRDWNDDKFAPVPGDDERIPLPKERAVVKLLAAG